MTQSMQPVAMGLLPRRSAGVAFLWWFFFGFFGAHRAYATGSGVILIYYWIFAIITFGFGPLIDAFFIPSLVRNENLKRGYLPDGRTMMPLGGHPGWEPRPAAMPNINITMSAPVTASASAAASASASA